MEYELEKLKQEISDKFEANQIEENHYMILDKKIDGYLTKIQREKPIIEKGRKKPPTKVRSKRT